MVNRLSNRMVVVVIVIIATLPLFGNIKRVEPLNWWIGMSTPLQLMVYGDGIAEANVESENKDLIIKKVIKPDSPNYLFLDVELSQNARAGNYTLIFKQGAQTFTYKYLILDRQKNSAQRQGFTSADMIYLIMPDRFSNGDSSNDSTGSTIEKANRKNPDGRHGGDIQGIINHLDYLKNLGVTAIWNTPLLLDNEPETTYHGYACADYYHVDPRYGSNELYQTLVREAHKRNIKIIMDFVPNHCGTAHWWFNNTPFINWMNPKGEHAGSKNAIGAISDTNGSEYDVNDLVKRWFADSMPDMNIENPYLLQYLTQSAVWWIEWSGLDGFRIDTYPYLERNQMSKMIKSIRTEYPNFNIAGECWRSQPPLVAYWQEKQHINSDKFNSNLPVVMDFPLESALTDKSDFPGKLMKIYDVLSQDYLYHNINNILIFADNHDMNRVATALNGNVHELKCVMTMLATLRGIPQLYSGTEIMMEGERKRGYGNFQREDFKGGWATDSINNFEVTQLSPEQKELFTYTQKLFTWRKSATAVHDGQTIHFKPNNGVYTYFRIKDNMCVMVSVNGNDKPINLPWNNFREVTCKLYQGVNIMTNEPIIVDAPLIIPAKESLVIQFSLSSKN